MSAETFLAALNGVRRTGNGRWLARCPAHADKSPSLSIRECDDGRVLLNCFAGCQFQEIVAASGVSLDELFPPKTLGGDYKPPERRPVHAEDALKTSAHELTTGFLILQDAAEHFRAAGFLDDELGSFGLSRAIVQRLFECAVNVSRVVEMATGRAVNVASEARHIRNSAQLRQEELEQAEPA